MFPSCARACPAGVILLLSTKSNDVGRAKVLLRRRSSSSSGISGDNQPPSLDPDETKDARGNTALHLAAIHDHSEIARVLVDAGASTEAAVSSGVNEGLTPLRLAAERGHLSTVRVLLEAGADANAKDIVDRATPLHAAAEAGHTSVVVELARRGGGGGGEKHHLEARAVSGQTPLRWALSLGRFEAAAALLSAGADPDAPDRRGACCLHTVAGLKTGDGCGGVGGMEGEGLSSPVVMAELLLSAGATPDLAHGVGRGRGGRRRWHRESDLSCALATVGESHQGVAPSGGNGSGSCAPDRNDDSGGSGSSGTSVGETPLHVAARESSVEVVEILLLHGADPNAKTSVKEGGLSPLHCAAAPGNEDSRRAVVRALLEAGAVIDAVSADGLTTPLKLACLNAAVGCVEELLRWGADDASCIPHRRSSSVISSRAPQPSASFPHLLQSPSVSDPSSTGFRLTGREAEAAVSNATSAAGSLSRLEDLVGSRMPVSARDDTDCQLIRRMLWKAPFDRAWRRRGWLVMLYARATTAAAMAAAAAPAAAANHRHAAATDPEQVEVSLRVRLPAAGNKRLRINETETTSVKNELGPEKPELREIVSRLFKVQGDESVLRCVVSWL